MSGRIETELSEVVDMQAAVRGLTEMALRYPDGKMMQMIAEIGAIAGASNRLRQLTDEQPRFVGSTALEANTEVALAPNSVTRPVDEPAVPEADPVGGIGGQAVAVAEEEASPLAEGPELDAASEMELTDREEALLEYMVANGGRPVRPGELCQQLRQTSEVAITASAARQAVKKFYDKAHTLYPDQIVAEGATSARRYIWISEQTSDITNDLDDVAESVTSSEEESGIPQPAGESVRELAAPQFEEFSLPGEQQVVYDILRRNEQQPVSRGELRTAVRLACPQLSVREQKQVIEDCLTNLNGAVRRTFKDGSQHYILDLPAGHTTPPKHQSSQENQAATPQPAEAVKPSTVAEARWSELNLDIKPEGVSVDGIFIKLPKSALDVFLKVAGREQGYYFSELLEEYDYRALKNPIDRRNKIKHLIDDITAIGPAVHQFADSLVWRDETREVDSEKQRLLVVRTPDQSKAVETSAETVEIAATEETEDSDFLVPRPE